MENETLDFSLNSSPSGMRKHIAIVGRTNTGKSMLINALSNQEVSLVSSVEGTTTDVVQKPMELFGVGAVMLMDTAGLLDNTELGEKRKERTLRALKKADAIIMLVDRLSKDNSEELYSNLKQYNVPIVPVLNKMDIGDIDFKLSFSDDIIKVSALDKKNIDGLLDRLSSILSTKEEFITRDLVQEGNIVLLVMPQDIQAPKGRLILPQVQVIRELLDRKCIVQCVTLDNLSKSLKLIAHIDLVITDSQAFKEVEAQVPKNIKLSSFSVLFAGYKGDIDYFVESAKQIDKLNSNSNILIAEACTHAPKEEDIGRVKIPKLLRKKYGNMNIDFVRGVDFSEDLSKYDLIIHCGACMFNKQHVISRVDQCKNKNVKMTNYGIALAKLNGILDRISY